MCGDNPNVEVWMVSLCGNMTVVSVAAKMYRPPELSPLVPVVFSDQLDPEECNVEGKCDVGRRG